MTTTTNCICPPCTTQDIRDPDTDCLDPDCPFGQVDPACPVHGDHAPPMCLGQARMDALADLPGVTPVRVDACTIPGCPVCDPTSGD